MEIVTDEDAVAGRYAFLDRYGCSAPEDVGMAIAEVARDLGYPMPPRRADPAAAAAGQLDFPDQNPVKLASWAR